MRELIMGKRMLLLLFGGVASVVGNSIISGKAYAADEQPVSDYGNVRMFINPLAVYGQTDFSGDPTLYADRNQVLNLRGTPSLGSTPMIEANTEEVVQLVINIITEQAVPLAQQVAASVADSAPGAYVPYFGGRDRDILASVVASVRAGITLAITNSRNYQLTTTGQWVVHISSYAAGLAVDVARFHYQEVMKAHLINRHKVNTEHAAYASWAVSQGIGLTAAVPIAYGMTWGAGKYFKRENESRVRKLQATDRRRAQWVTSQQLLDYLNSEKGRNEFIARYGRTDYLILHQETVWKVGADRKSYIDGLSEFRKSDDSPWGNSIESTPAGDGKRRLLNSYTADLTTLRLGAPNYRVFYDAIQKDVTSKCRTYYTYSRDLVVSCPTYGSPKRRLTVTHTYLSRMSKGGIVPYENYYFNEFGVLIGANTGTMTRSQIGL